MTNEEAILVLDSLSTWLGSERPITEEIVEAIKTLSHPSIPSNIDEAAEEYSLDVKAKPYENLVKEAFKHGAAWRDSQILKLPSNLDNAAEKYANKEFPDEPSCGQWGTGDYEPPVDMEYPREIAKEAFISGAKWSEQVSRNTLNEINDINEAAKNLINDIFFEDGRYDGDFIIPICEDIFKAGAEWMAGQGTIKYWMAKDKDDSLLISNFKPYRRHNGYLDVDSFKWINISPRLSRELFPNIKFEDNPVEVTIQIRKKQ